MSKVQRRGELVNIEMIIARTLTDTMDPSIITQQLVDILQSIAKEKVSSTPLSSVNNIGPLTTKDVLMVALYGYSLLGDSVPIMEEYELLLKLAFVKTMTAVT